MRESFKETSAEVSVHDSCRFYKVSIFTDNEIGIRTGDSVGTYFGK